MMETDLSTVAQELHSWFGSISRLTDESLFGHAPEGPHRDAVVLDVLKRNARIVFKNEMDGEGKLYSSLCFFLAAACRMLKVSLGVGHWQAALENVIHLQQQLVHARMESVKVGLEFGTPVVLFKQLFDEAIDQAGLGGGVSYLDKENRQVALGLAINWGMRLLLAYALEYRRPTGDSDVKDLGWLTNLVRPHVSASSSCQ